ncbi:hypothetical protein KKG24_03790 [Patescibacteria group bacterium]|nr:hypothetical protein [Patescibacteria group bacterium]
MNEPIDLLQIKIEKAKMQLSEDTQNAINSVDWKVVVLEMREKRGYSFEQLGDLEIETELLLCGLLSPEDYPKELENRMHLSKSEVDGLIKEMNSLVFTKIKENLIKNTERKKLFIKKIPADEAEKKEEGDAKILNPADIKIIPDLPAALSVQPKQEEKIEPTITEKPKIEPPPILAQKLSGSFQAPIVKTEHSLNNLTPSNPPKESESPAKPAIDPYREIPE